MGCGAGERGEKRAMATTSIVGLKIRETRRALGLSQTDLAQQMGISPAYLNLIEFSKRRIGGSLLRRAAECLDLPLSELDGAAEQRLATELAEISADQAMQDAGLDPGNIEQFIGRFPGWARALVKAYRSNQDNSELATALSDRLRHDPFLSDIVHQMLTHISSIRSTSEILHDISEIEPEQRRRFHRALAGDSNQLSDVAQALAQYFDKAHTADRTATPAEEVETFLLSHRNYFDDLEVAADDMRGRLTDAVVPDDLAGEANLDRRALTVVETHMADAVQAVLDGQGQALSAVSRRQIARILRRYSADALLLPAGPFALSANEKRYDLELLREHWRVPFHHLCRRLTALSGRGGEEQVLSVAYLAANASGQTIDRRPAFGLPVPLYGSACPLWAIYRAFAEPGWVIRQVGEFPDGRRVLMVARARRTGRTGFDQPADHVSDMIAVPIEQADRIVYGDGLDLAGAVKAEPIGPTCRVCPRTDCDQRAEDPFAG